jgi:hypothetical protein
MQGSVSSGDIAIRYFGRSDSIPGRGRVFSLLHSSHTEYGGLNSLISMDIQEDSFFRVKPKVAHSHPSSTEVESDEANYLIKHRDRFTFTQQQVVKETVKL